MVAKKFFYVCGGIFLLVAAYALGARQVEATGGGSAVAAFQGGVTEPITVVTSTGDVFVWSQSTATWSYHSNALQKAVPIELSKFKVGQKH